MVLNLRPLHSRHAYTVRNNCYTTGEPKVEAGENIAYSYYMTKVLKITGSPTQNGESAFTKDRLTAT